MVDFTPDDTPERRAWRHEVQEFLAKELPADYMWGFDTDDGEDGWDAATAFWRKVGARGWVGLTWPKAYFGQGRDALDKWILDEALADAGAPPYPVVGLGVAEAVLRLGTHEQRLKHLGGIAHAETWWGEGFTEPEAGSDLAALETRADRDGDEWVINGQKTFGTAMHRCGWMYLFARTDQEAPKHASITCFLLPVDSPGITISPLYNVSGGRQNQTFYDNVRVPLDAVLGDVNRGWQQVWFRMGGERLDRAAPTPAVFVRRLGVLLNELVEYCGSARRGGVRLIDDPVVRGQLADLMVSVEALKMLDYERFWQVKSGVRSPVGEAAGHFMNGVYKEIWPKFAQTCMEIVGPMGQVQKGNFAPMFGAVERFWRTSFGNHGGGTSQIKRMVVATRGLGLPR